MISQNSKLALATEGSQMFRRTIFILLSLTFGFGAVQAKPMSSAERGFAYVQKNCTECHAVRRGDGFSPNPDAPAFQRLANIRGVSWIALTAWLQRAHETMPDFIIPPHDREDTIAYILSLKGKGRSE